MRPEDRGYIPKIEYWTTKLKEAEKINDIYEINSIYRKLDFFIRKQWDLDMGIEEVEPGVFKCYYIGELEEFPELEL